MKGEKGMVTVIKGKKLGGDPNYESPMKSGWRIDSTTVQHVKMVMGYTTGLAGTRNQRHYHVNTACGIFEIKGRSQMVVGPDYAKEEFILEPGDFMYVPKGEIHGTFILEDSAVVFCYPDVSSEEEAGTIFIEPPHEK
jgi:uncharacterized RmlC-like cupin family protein